MNFEDLGLAQAASEIKTGRISPVEYVRALLTRIDRLEPEVFAWATIDRAGALQEAQRCEDEVRNGQWRGPLHGVPIGLKDIFRTKGLRTAAGSRFLHDYIPDYDAESVIQLKRAGAIILGKTVTTEFATFDAGPTRNPCNLAHTPGGSSSGSAAAVAARMCPAATGTQTVGSIGRPAAYCGAVGFMPTQARVSRSGVFPVSWSLDHIGGFTRSVGDARLFLEALCGEVVPRVQLPAPIRIGIIRGFFSEKASPETRELHEQLLRQLDGSSFILGDASLPQIFEIQSAISRMILRTELASAHAEFHPIHSVSYGAKLRALVETGMLVSATDYLRALRLRKVYQREMSRMFEKFEVLVTPGAMDTAPEGLGHTGDAGFTGPWALADFPSITIPHARAANGLPVAIQLSAAPMQEPLLFSVAESLESVIGFKM